MRKQLNLCAGVWLGTLAISFEWRAGANAETKHSCRLPSKQSREAEPLGEFRNGLIVETLGDAIITEVKRQHRHRHQAVRDRS